MTSCVVALGKIGLPLAVQIASKNEHVIGADINPSVVELVSSGKEPFPGEAELAERLIEVIDNDLLEATTDTTEAVRKSDYVIVVVPVIVDDQGNPDFSAIDAATTDIAKGLTDGCLVSYETTLPIGTTRERFLPALESESGLKCGSDFFLCHSPERVFSGRIFADLRKYPKLVGGTDRESSRKAVEFYEKILDFDDRDDLEKPNGVWDLGSSEAAEMAKLVETTYRNVNIALANEFALHAQDLGLDIFPVIDAANSQPFSHIHQPGIAVGGHCIPVYPKFYMASDTGCNLPAVSVEINESMPVRAIDMLKAEISSLNGKRIAILGAAYRGGVKETAFSGVFPLAVEIEKLGGIPVVHDPMFSAEELNKFGLLSFELKEHCDLAIVQADHEIYANLTAEDLPGVSHLFDGRNIVNKTKLAPINVIRLGDGTR
tara:strand:- start:240 stop:1535 length:1296 start_codon:yes stop_codon:yes gene_type:complete